MCGSDRNRHGRGFQHKLNSDRGQKVKKGDQLGYFAFGGSSYVMVFDKDLKVKFDDNTFKPNSDNKSNKVLVN